MSRWMAFEDDEEIPRTWFEAGCFLNRACNHVRNLDVQGFSNNSLDARRILVQAIHDSREFRYEVIA